MFGPRARELFVASFTVLMRSWQPVAVVSVVMFVGQAVMWSFVSLGLDRVFAGDFAEAVDRALRLGSTPGGSPTDDDIEFFESIEFDLTAAAVLWFAAAVLVAWVSYGVTVIGWLRAMTAGRNGVRLAPTRAIIEALRRFPRTAIAVVVVTLPFAVAVVGLSALLALEPLLFILLMVPLAVLGFVWALFMTVTVATASIAPRGTAAIRTAVALIRRQRSHAAKCLVMSILPAMVVGFGGGLLGQFGLVFGLWGYLAMTTVSGVVQAAVQTAALAAMYISLSGETDPELVGVA